ncbi:hypothetical protein COOONC_15722 [Cooperia oncophora]
MSGSRDFSSIARSLLLKQPSEEVRRTNVTELEVTRPVAEQRAQSNACLCTAFQAVSLEMFVSNEASSSEKRRVLSPETKAVIANVKQFFAKLKEHLGPTSRGTVFSSVTAITATACGVSDRMVEKVTNTPVRPAITQSARKSCSRKAAVMTAMNNLGPIWGERIRRLVHRMLKDEKDVTILELRQEMMMAYPDFTYSSTTLWRLVKGLGFSYKILKGQRYIFERSDLAKKRSLYLRKIEEARRRGDCIVYMDETWVFAGMVKRRGWSDNTMSRFPTAAEIQRYSCGKTAGKNKGRRGIVMTAMSEDGIVPGCTNVFVDRHRTMHHDSTREMDHIMFENWLESSIPLMKEFAAGRNVTLVLDNAPYHTRALEKVRFSQAMNKRKKRDMFVYKIPTRHSTKREIISFLSFHGVEVAIDSEKASVVEELEDFVASRGGRAALRCFAAESICEDMGVRTRALDVLEGVTRSHCEGWCRAALEEEDSARMKDAPG